MAEWLGGDQKTLSRQGLEVGGNNLGEGTTVWDGEMARMAEALEQRPRDQGILILADSQAAIQAVKKAGRVGKASLSGWWRKWGSKGEVGLGEGHEGILGNKRADERAKFFTKVVGPEVLTEGGIKLQLTARRMAELAQVEWGRGKIAGGIHQI